LSGTSYVTLSGGTSYVTLSGTSTVAYTPTQYDAFGRIRMSQPFTLFDATNVNYESTKFTTYTNTPNVSGPSNNYTNYDVNSSTVDLICNVAGSVVREGKYICSYQPGKSLLILNTFVMNSSHNNLIQRVGYYNDSNGIYLEQDISGYLYMVVRSSVSGSPFNDRVIQSDWVPNDLQKAGITLDITSAQIFFIDIEWLGVGSVRTGFVINGNYYLAHIFNHANVKKSTYMTSARLSPRYEIIHSSGTGTGYKLKQICSTVISEGGYEAKSIQRHVGNGDPSGFKLTTGSQFPFISIKLNNLSNVAMNSIVLPSEATVAIFNTNSNQSIVYYKLLLNTTITPTPVYSSYNTLNPYDPITSSVTCWINPSGVSNYSVSGGTIVNAGFVTTYNVFNLDSVTDFNLQIGRNFSGSTNIYSSDTMTLCIIPINIQSGGNTGLFAQLGWYEL